MEQEISEEELKSIAAQLSRPEGKEGIDMAQLMHETNINMTLSTIQLLALQPHDRLLELGHGNCAHLNEILKQAENVRYYGLEISAAMKEEAEKINAESVARDCAVYHLYDGNTIPFEDESFENIMTVNTIYFWEQAVALLKEIYRVLKKGGKVCITYAHKDFMQKLPFTRHGFELYDQEKIEKLVSQTSFTLADVVHKTERVKSKTGEMVERHFSVAVLEK
ncbi:class I SAM-dependent methyltransferase [Catalinimonas sp. 4WD22]|uniref:class I SAM-dependent methyltransferase n=1 Tax=Catalinimonas locisalis TaxID=3133978 RepID=UPI0031015384